MLHVRWLGDIRHARDAPISSKCVQGQDEGAVWAQMAERAASPGGPWRMGGLGFGLPLSRLYARYFGKLLAYRPCPELLLWLWRTSEVHYTAVLSEGDGCYVCVYAP